MLSYIALNDEIPYGFVDYIVPKAINCDYIVYTESMPLINYAIIAKRTILYFLKTIIYAYVLLQTYM